MSALHDAWNQFAPTVSNEESQRHVEPMSTPQNSTPCDELVENSPQLPCGQAFHMGIRSSRMLRKRPVVALARRRSVVCPSGKGSEPLHYRQLGGLGSFRRRLLFREDKEHIDDVIPGSLTEGGELSGCCS